MRDAILYSVAFTILLVMTIFEMSELVIDATKNSLTVKTIAIALGSAAALGVLILAYRNHLKNKVGDLEGGGKEMQRLRADLDLLRAEVDDLREQIKRGRTVSFTRASGQYGSKPCLKQRPVSPGGYSVTSEDDYFTDADDDWGATPGNAAPVANGIPATNGPPPSTDRELTFARLDKLFEELNGADEQYDTCKKMLSSSPDDSEVLWRISRACHLQTASMDKKNPALKEKLFEGREYGQRACALAPTDFEAIKWAAVLTGSATDYLPVKERIEQGNVFKDYLDRALSMSPRDFTVLHMRGRFRFSVSQLSWMERKMASAFFGEPPTATIDEAIEDFVAADEVKPEWAENMFWLGKSYLAKKDKAKARTTLQQCSQLDGKDEGAKACIAEAAELLAKC